MKIEVVKSNPKWVDEFSLEKSKLKNALGDLVIDVHHIGSTSILGLASKPIIDIILEVSSLSVLDEKISIMNSLGYEGKGEYGIVGRRYFVKGGSNRSHQIHAFIAEDENINRHIAFREYLKFHPEVLKEYAALKQKLAKECNNNIDLYCDGKDEFVKLYESKAILWQANT